MNVSPRAGKPAEPSVLVNVPKLVTAYYIGNYKGVGHRLERRTGTRMNGGAYEREPTWSGLEGHL